MVSLAEPLEPEGNNARRTPTRQAQHPDAPESDRSGSMTMNTRRPSSIRNNPADPLDSELSGSTKMNTRRPSSIRNNPGDPLNSQLSGSFKKTRRPSSIRDNPADPLDSELSGTMKMKTRRPSSARRSSTKNPPNRYPSSDQSDFDGSGSMTLNSRIASDPEVARLDLEWLLSLEERRKAKRRGSFLSTEFVPRRSVVERGNIMDFLRSQGFTIGLAKTLINNTDAFAVRIWIVDNSASMNSVDGHRVVQSPDPPYRLQNVDCTRWEEVSTTLLWHAQFSAMMEAPMVIRFVNSVHSAGPQQMGIAASERVDIQGEMKRLQTVVQNVNPEGNDPLLVHLKDVVESILLVPPKQLGEKSISIILVTDHAPRDQNGQEGEAVNREFVHTLQRLDGLAVWIVIRLSTDESSVVDFYNSLDKQMSKVNVMVDIDSRRGTGGEKVQLDVLDDYLSEAQQVQLYNPWLNYCYPLHLCRESTVNFPVLDVLNDRPLHIEELAEFMCLLFDRQGGLAWDDQPLPSPKDNYPRFRSEVKELLGRNPGLWNPIKKRIVPLIDLKQLDRQYAFHEVATPSSAQSPGAATSPSSSSCCTIL